jgi:hypothetical protein
MAFADKFVADAAVEPAGYRQLTPSVAQGVSIPNARVALIRALNQNVRFRDDGSDPTSSVGFRLHAGQSIWYIGDMKQLRMIEEAASAEVNILGYK